jgi:hypothetical protein
VCFVCFVVNFLSEVAAKTAGEDGGHLGAVSGVAAKVAGVGGGGLGSKGGVFDGDVG